MAELGEQPVRLFEMLANRFMVLGRVADLCFDPFGQLRVQLRALSLEKAPIRGIANEHNTLNVSNTTVSGNSATFTTDGGGGGLYNGHSPAVTR